MDPILFGAMSAAIHGALRFHAVADDLTSTVCAFWCKHVNGTFEAIEHMGLTVDLHYKTFIVLVATYFAYGQPLAYQQIGGHGPRTLQYVYFFHGTHLLSALGAFRFSGTFATRTRFGRRGFRAPASLCFGPGLKSITAHVYWLDA
jgi:hypothetical protein